MANTGTQIDKVSVENCILKRNDRKNSKKEHTRKKRRESKKIDSNPMWNRYDGWIA